MEPAGKRLLFSSFLSFLPFFLATFREQDYLDKLENFGRSSVSRPTDRRRGNARPAVM